VEERTCVSPKQMALQVIVGKAYGAREMSGESSAPLSMPLTGVAVPPQVRMEDVRGAGSGRQPGGRSGNPASCVATAPPAGRRAFGGLPCRW
jgi:hypothetical protein